MAAALAVGGFAVGRYVLDEGTSGTTATTASGPSAPNAWGSWPGSTGSGAAAGFGAGTGSTGSTGETRSATSAEQVGVVDITTVLDYGSGKAAGTGIVLTSSGEILTNNHVIADSTKITVTVVSTGRSYSASVVGTDPTDDLAVLQLAGASGLTTAKLANAATVAGLSVGDAVTAVGNAGGTGGTPTAATGRVVALDQKITATDESGADPEQLDGLIEVDAAVRAGDSGGPLYSGGAVVGIDTAGSSGGAASDGYAIPITTAVGIADRIESGEASSTIHQGYSAFLGVQLSGTDYGAGYGTGGAAIVGTVPGSPAASAGLQAGDTVTAIDGTAVSSADTLSSALGTHRPGDRVRLTWIDADGTSHTATVTLVAGPAD